MVLLVTHREGNLPSDYVSTWLYVEERFYEQYSFTTLLINSLLFGEGFPRLQV